MQVYLVGGAVRDELLGISGADRDFVVVGATIEEMRAQGFAQVGQDFPVFLHPETHEEYALARTERKHGHGYTGFICDFSPQTTLEEDLLRRDLTINAIAKNLESGELIDPYGGLQDLKNKVLRHVSPAFVEDPLRVLRVARFAAERVWIELEKALNTPDPEVFIEILHFTGALGVVLPEVEALSGVPGPKRWHPEVDTLVHTVMTLHRIACETHDPVARFAMLCHDLGKGLTPKENWPHHKNHNVLGLKPLEAMCKRLKVPNDYYDFAKLVVFYYSFVHHLYQEGAYGIVMLLNHLDAWRRPERIKPWILCCKCDFLGRKGFEARPFPRAEYLYEMFSICRTVTAKEFVEQGLKGAAIKDAMFERRVALVAEFMKTIPQGELDDHDNSSPAAESVRD